MGPRGTEDPDCRADFKPPQNAGELGNAHHHQKCVCVCVRMRVCEWACGRVCMRVSVHAGECECAGGCLFMRMPVSVHKISTYDSAKHRKQLYGVRRGHFYRRFAGSDCTLAHRCCPLFELVDYPGEATVINTLHVPSAFQLRIPQRPAEVRITASRKSSNKTLCPRNLPVCQNQTV